MTTTTLTTNALRVLASGDIPLGADTRHLAHVLAAEVLRHRLRTAHLRAECYQCDPLGVIATARVLRALNAVGEE